MVDTFSPEQQQTIERAANAEHRYVLRWLEGLGEAERDALLEQLATVDFERVVEFARLIGLGRQEQSFEDVEPAPVQRLADAKGEAQVAEAGAAALRDDRVAALTVAGGQGTRLGYDAPKGTYPITPVLKKTLFQVLAEKILAARLRYGCRMPWLIMTSQPNDGETREFFKRQGYFDLREDSVHFFTQQANPILARGGRMLRQEPGSLLTGPDGHGGVFEALAGSGLLDTLQHSGHDLLSCFQVDNPLVTVADERFLGHHLADGAEFSCKVIAKRGAAERLGVAVLRSGTPCIVEYSDLPGRLAQQRLPSGELKYPFGSIAVHIISTPFARRVGGGDVSLPWHVACRDYDVLDEDGNKGPAECYKFERFVFDCMPHARACAFVEVNRQDEFAPVKNADGEDSPDTCRAMMRAMWMRWLKAAGADVTDLEEPEAEIEIGPLFATSGAELREKQPANWRPAPPVVLDAEPGRREESRQTAGDST